MLKRNGILSRFNFIQIDLIQYIFGDKSPIMDNTEALELINEAIVNTEEILLIEELEELKSKFVSLPLVIINIIIDNTPFDNSAYI